MFQRGHCNCSLLISLDKKKETEPPYLALKLPYNIKILSLSPEFIKSSSAIFNAVLSSSRDTQSLLATSSSSKRNGR